MLRIAGREFTGVSHALTAAQDNYLIGQLRISGALELLRDNTKSPEDQAEDMLTRIMISGRTHFVLAGCLTEQGKTWSTEEAERNAAVFAAVTDADEKRAMTEGLLGFVLGFFQFATRSVATLAKSSNRS